MRIRWRLRMAAAQREVWTGTQLRRLLAERAGLAARLSSPPDWLGGFIACLADSYSPGQAASLITILGRLLEDDGQPGHPQALLERARWQGRSMGPLARSLEAFFTEHGLAIATDHAEQLAAGRRQRRVDAVPGPLRPAVDAFALSMLTSRERARRAGTRPRSDHTIEAALATMRDLALFLEAERGKRDWALADVHDIDAFLAALPRGRKRRLTVLRQFFRFVRGRKIILADPTRGLAAREPRGFTGQTLPFPLKKQRELFRRWTTAADTHPHEALLGILALLHGASSDEVRHLRESDIDQAARTAELGSRPLPVPLDPASWQVLQRCLDHRETQRTANPHVIVTRGTKAGRSPASTAYISHVLDGCGIPPQALRCTRLADLVNTMDPNLVAAAFGMKPEGVMYYLADHFDPGRLTAPSTSTSEALPVEPSPVLGASRSLIEGAWNWPVHGLRYPSTPGTTGWYVWTGELSDADDFFQPWHATHLIERCPELEHLLDLPPGSRFVFAPGYEDIWNDPSLLDP